MATWDEAIAEAMASGDQTEVLIETLELRHPKIINEFGDPAPIRVVKAYTDYNCRLEVDAPSNPGEVVLFQKCQFEVIPPGMEENKGADMQIRIGGVSRQVTAYLEEAILSLDPVEVSYRTFLLSDLDGGPTMEPVWTFTMRDIDVDDFTISGVANLEDMHNAPFPSTKYTPSRFPGLVR